MFSRGAQLPLAMLLPHGRHVAARMQSQTVKPANASARPQVLGIELTGEVYYRTLANKSPAPLDKMCLRLADEEHKQHAALVKSFEEGEIRVLPKPDFYEQIQSLCHDSGRNQSQSDLLKMYTTARDLEAQHRDNYCVLAGTEPNPKTQQLWESLANEKNNRYEVFENMLQLARE